MIKNILAILFFATATYAATTCSEAFLPCMNLRCEDPTFQCVSFNDEFTCCPPGDIILDNGGVNTTAAPTTSGTNNTGTTAAGATTPNGSRTTSTSVICLDLVNPKTGVSDCPARVSYCNDPIYYDLMTHQCPKTCNRCSSITGSTSTGCVDLLNPATKISDCPQRVSYCSDPVYFDVMRVQCPKTCGFCGGATRTPTTVCADRTGPSGVSDCSKKAYLCKNSAYASLMKTECPKTCGFC